MQSIRQSLTLARKQSGLTQAKIAKLANITQPQLSAFERGGEVLLSTAENIAHALDMRLVALPQELLLTIEHLIADYTNTEPPTDDLLQRYHIPDND